MLFTITLMFGLLSWLKMAVCSSPMDCVATWRLWFILQAQ